MEGYLKHLHISTVLFFIGITIVTAEMTRYVTDQEMVNQLALQLSHMTLSDLPGMSPYYKFGSNYSRISVCSLKNLQKLEMCDMLLGDDRYQYIRPKQFRPRLSCIRIEIQIASSETYTKAFKCPTPDRIGVSSVLKPVSVLFTTTVAYFISSASEANSVTLYYKYPGTLTKIKPDMTVLNFPMKHLKWLIKEDRKKPYMKNKDPFYGMYHEIGPQRNYEWTKTTIRNPPTAENEVLFFERNIRRNTMIYRKFQASWQLTHICSYTSQQLAYLCSQVIENDAFGFELRNDFETTNRCERRLVHFPHSLYGFPHTSLHLVQCPLAGLINKNSYFISSSAVLGKVILHVQYNPHEEIIPEGYAPAPLKNLDLLKEISS